MNKLYRVLISSILSIVIAVAALAQEPAQISSERLRTHVTYLAGDALEGRRTGTPGANEAAKYIAGQFAQLGLRNSSHTGKASDNGKQLSGYFQNFPYVGSVELGKGNELAIGESAGSKMSFRAGVDWMPLGISSNSRIENSEAVFVGYGITAADLKHDDYAEAKATGKVAIAFAGTPDGDNPHGQFARYEDVRWKAIAARNAGARALVVIAREQSFKDDRLSRLRYDHNAGDAGLPVIVISRLAALRLLNLKDETALAQLQKTISRISLNLLNPPAGWSVEKESWHAPKVAQATALAIDVIRKEVSASNVIGILEGSDPKLKHEAIIIGAHYDHLGRGGSGSLAQREGDVHHGADDNASGVAGILELARLFTSPGFKPRRTVVFAAFGGEEEGLLGSNYYVNHPIVPLANTVAMINLDMIGRLKNRNLIIGGVGTATEWRPLIENANLWQGMTVNLSGASENSGNTSTRAVPVVIASNGRAIVTSDSSKMFLLTLNEDGFGPSDHASFYARQIPVLFFWTGTHEDYHKPSDTAEKINYEGEAQILSMVARIVREVDASDKPPTYTAARAASPGRTIGFRVYLGTIPNYADSNDGLLLDGVREESPAAEAGLQAGDRIVKLAGREVRNVYDYTAALSELKAGQEYEVEIVRGTERLSLRLVPAAARR